MQEVDDERRLAILRRDTPLPLAPAEETSEPPVDDRRSQRDESRKKRKAPGEDDTDFELRIAKRGKEVLWGQIERARKPTSSAPIIDRSGHIDLFGDHGLRRRIERKDEAEKQSLEKKKQLEDEHTMRFSNAGGKSGVHDPWYSKGQLGATEGATKDVCGNEDAGRKGRDMQRMESNDPLVLMKKGASQVRALKRERTRDLEERDAELTQLRQEQDRRDRRRRDAHSSRHLNRSERDSDGRRRRSRDGDGGSRREGSSRHSRSHGDRDADQSERRRSRSPDQQRHRHRYGT